MTHAERMATRALLSDPAMRPEWCDNHGCLHDRADRLARLRRVVWPAATLEIRTSFPTCIYGPRDRSAEDNAGLRRLLRDLRFLGATKEKGVSAHVEWSVP